MSRVDRFLNVIHGKVADTTPIWIMRQAGRFLPEYNELRAKYSFLQMCKTPELACEVTLMPVKRFELDAAILFSDILICLEAMGVNVTFIDGKGPVLEPPIRTQDQINALSDTNIEEKTAFVAGTVKIIKNEISGKIPLIGFAGAPFTVACYGIEGGGSKNFRYVKELIYSKPEAFQRLMDKITNATIAYLKMQVRSGVDTVQLFDTWGGLLSEKEYERFSFPYVKKIISSIKKENVPVIYFVLNGAHLLEKVKDSTASVIGVDWRVPIEKIRSVVGDKIVLQGNMDPGLLYGTKEAIKEAVQEIIKGAGRAHIFNLGHGIWPDVPIENVQYLIDTVHKYGER